MSSNREFEALFAAALDAVFVIDDGRVITGLNPAACQLLGRLAGEVVGRRFDDLLEHRESVPSAWQTFITSGQQVGPLRLVRPDGSRREVEYSATANFMAGRHLAILRDVTERKEAEAARDMLARREALRLRETEMLLAVSRTLSSTLDPTETMRRVSREIARAMEADMVGAYLADPAQNYLHPVAGYRVPKDMLAAFQERPIPIKHHRAIEEAWTAGRAVWTMDMASDARVDRASYLRFPHQSDLFTPIRVKGRPVGGFFVIWWHAQRSFADDEIRLLEGICDLAGIFLENAQLYRDAAEANRAKDEFMAVLSHELRNPLGAIANAAAVLDYRGGQSDADFRMRQIIHRQTRHLARLVDDLLDVARVTAGKMALDRQSLDLAEVVGICVRVLRDGPRGREHSLSFRSESVMVSADPTRLEQVVTNLVDNALKYTPVGGAIDVEVLRDGDDAVLRVTDTGNGIPADMLSRIFEPFTQAEQALDRSLGGLGLGLTLSRRLVELHGGTIQAFSEGSNRGAQFVVRLPVDATDAVAASLPSRGPAVVRNILIIEDNDDARESLRLLLESLGHQVVDAGDGRHGVALALQARPDIVLVDLGLPGIDGYEVARAIRASGLGKSVRLVAVTGYGQKEDRRRSTEAGFDAHLVKPVSPTALSGVLAG
jgi:PAS domain S-box-containing protein